MPLDTDELEHDTHEHERAKRTRGGASLPSPQEKPPPPQKEPEDERRKAIKDQAGRKGKPWCTLDNPAIWSGERDED